MEMESVQNVECKLQDGKIQSLEQNICGLNLTVVLILGGKMVELGTGQ
jgi:hypothetical protein